MEDIGVNKIIRKSRNKKKGLIMSTRKLERELYLERRTKSVTKVIKRKSWG